jgi:1,2-diacylglycerol 3-alpha-glucosyltransferase
VSRSLVVGQFNDSFKPIMDGVGLCVENYTRWLDAKHGSAYAIVPHVPRYVDNDTFPIIRYPSLPLLIMPPYRLGVPWASPAVGKLLTVTPFDLVHSHSPFVAGRMAQRTAERHSIPHVTTFHTKYREDARRYLRSERLAEIFIHQILRFYDSCDAVWTPSEATEAILRGYGYQGEITVAPNGSDLSPPTPDEYARYRRKGQTMIRMPEDTFVFLFVGQHRWEKNVKLIIRTIGRLQEHGGLPCPIALVFAGEGYASEMMRRLAGRVGIGEQTRFLGKIVGRERIKGLYARADLFFFPSIYDNAPLVMREAAAFGVPTVVARGSSAAEAIVDGKNGFAVPNDPDAAADILYRLLHNRDLIKRVGEDASRTVYRGWEEIVEWVAVQYEQIIAKHAKRCRKLHV